MSAKTILLCASAFSLLAAGAAQAKAWVVTIGGRLNTAPPYEGADHNINRPSPTLSVRPADRPYRFTPPDGGTTFALIDTDHFTFGPMARFRYKRGAEGNLQGLHEIKWAAEPGAFLDIWPTKWLRARGELRHGVGGHTGFVADLGGDLVYTGKRWDASIGPRMGWGDRNYLNEYFGVTALEAARSPLIDRAYAPTAGRRYTGVEVAGAYHLDSRWTVKFDAGWRRLADRAADSPIVQVAGDTTQVLGSVGVSYSFGVRL
ncbi:MAG TPA: MipA/OmpV family protein [Caulobacteraceae bacterium]|nr:MipA/OmpV family protein [Caulobacteraceae bacterium]